MRLLGVCAAALGLLMIVTAIFLGWAALHPDLRNMAGDPARPPPFGVAVVVLLFGSGLALYARNLFARARRVASGLPEQGGERGALHTIESVYGLVFAALMTLVSVFVIVAGLLDRSAVDAGRAIGSGAFLLALFGGLTVGFWRRLRAQRQ